MQMTNVIIGILALILFLSKMKWRITALSLICFYMRYKRTVKKCRYGDVPASFFRIVWGRSFWIWA